MTILLKASEQYFYMVLFRILYKTIGLDSANPCVLCLKEIDCTVLLRDTWYTILGRTLNCSVYE